MWTGKSGYQTRMLAKYIIILLQLYNCKNNHIASGNTCIFGFRTTEYDTQ